MAWASALTSLYFLNYQINMGDQYRYREQRLVAKAFIATDDNRETVELFEAAPLFAAAPEGYGNPTGTTGDINIMKTEQNNFEYHIKGTQTILAPVFGSSGLDVGMDQTSGDGVEITQGVTSRSKAAFIAGTDKFFAELKLSVADVSGLSECAFGIRTASAITPYQANIDDYLDMAALNIQAGTINLETILNNAGTATTDTTTVLADGGEVTLKIEVLTDQTCRFYVNGSRVLSSNAFAFDSGDTLFPFFFMLNGADLGGAVNLKSWKVGLLPR
jgi:hypothetical protein